MSVLNYSGFHFMITKILAFCLLPSVFKPKIFIFLKSENCYKAILVKIVIFLFYLYIIKKC